MKKSLRTMKHAIALTLLSATMLLTACGPQQPLAATLRVPSPVVENGMTLVWGPDVKTEALHMIQQSKQYCYLDIYELSDADILHALISAKERGVDVRVVVDATEKHSQETGQPTLQKAGVPCEALHISRGISHIKMLLTEGTSGPNVLIGGMNFGQNSWDNNDASVYFTHANPSFYALFNWDWLRAAGTPAAAPGYQPPLLNDRSTEQHVVDAIQQAKTSVQLEAFDLSDRGVLSALETAARRGILVEVLLDPSQYPNRKTSTALRDAGVTIRFYQPYAGEFMHAKILDVDHGAVFLIGSANFSHQGYTYNHEGDVELHNVPAFAKAFESNLSIQISRGTDYPESHKTTW